MRLGFDPRRRYLTGPPAGSPSAVYRKRRLLAAFDPRVRYLRGLGQDDITAADLQELSNPSGANDIYGQGGPSQTDALIAAETGLPVGIYSAQPMTSPVRLLPGLSTTTTLFATPSTAASLANRPAATAAASTNWFSQTNPTLGISNGLLLGGVGAIAALVLLSGSKRR